MSTCKDLVMLRRSTRAFELIFTKDNVAIDITGWTIYFTAKVKMEDTDENAVINKVITPENPGTGKLLIEFTAEDTALDPKNYWHAIDYKDNENNEGTLFSGKLTIKKSVRDTRG